MTAPHPTPCAVHPRKHANSHQAAALASSGQPSPQQPWPQKAGLLPQAVKAVQSAKRALTSWLPDSLTTWQIRALFAITALPMAALQYSYGDVGNAWVTFGIFLFTLVFPIKP